MKTFVEYLNEDNIALVEEASKKPEFKDVTKEELHAIYNEVDLDKKKEKAIDLVNSLTAKKEKAKLILSIQNAKSLSSIDSIVTNVALVPLKVVK